MRLTYFPPRLFQIAQSTDAYGADLFLNDRVGDIFADNEVLRVVKGSSIRDSLPPDYVNVRAGSVQPSYPPQRKRSPATSNLGDNSRAGKRQKIYRPDDPLPSRERDPYESEEGSILADDIPVDEVIPNSQGYEAESGGGHIKQEKPLQANRPSFNQPSPVLGEEDDEEVVVSDSQGKETSGRNITPQNRQSLQTTTKAQEGRQTIAKTTPKPSNSTSRRPSSKRRARSDDISDSEEHKAITPSVTPSRGISDPYSDIETDLEQPSSILRLRRRVTPLRKSNKASPISAKPKLIQYSMAATRSKAGSSSNNSTPKAIASSAPAITPRSARTANSDVILPGMTRQSDGASAHNGDDNSDGSVDAGAEEAAQEISRLASESARKKRVAELAKDHGGSISKAKLLAAAASKRQAKSSQKQEAVQSATEEKVNEKSEKEARAAEAKAKREKERTLSEEARRHAEATEKAEAEKREEAKRQEAEEAKRRQAEAAAKIETAKREEAKKREAEAAAVAEAVKRDEASKIENEAKEKNDAAAANARKKSTPSRSPGGLLGRAVAEFDSKAASTSPGTNVADMPPPPATARGRQSTSPALTRKRSADIRTTPILPPQVSSDMRPSSSAEPGSAARRVSFAEPSPSAAGKTPSKTTPSPAPVQTPKTVNGIQNSSGSFRQSKLVPPGTGAKSVTPKVSTPSSSQAPTSGQQVKSTPTPRTRGNISAALLNTINKGSCELQSCYSIIPNGFLEQAASIAIFHKLTIYSISSEGGSGPQAKYYCHLL